MPTLKCNHEFDGTNSRLRWGIAPCLEVLVDLPTYFAAVRGQLNSGFTNVIPAIKWQISPVPGKIDFSATFGAGLPTGNKAIAGPRRLPEPGVGRRRDNDEPGNPVRIVPAQRSTQVSRPRNGRPE